MNGQRRRKSRCTNLHHLCRAHALWHRHYRLGREPRVLGITAVARFTQSATIDENRHAWFKLIALRAHNCTREIDAADERKLPQDPSFAGRRKRMLVIDRRVADFDDDVACAQVIDVQLAEISDDVAILLVNTVGTKILHPVPSYWFELGRMVEPELQPH